MESENLDFVSGPFSGSGHRQEATMGSGEGVSDPTLFLSDVCCESPPERHHLGISDVRIVQHNRCPSLKITFGFLAAGVYKVTPRSCHRFEQAFYTYDT